jgi:hypothetical protein
MDVILSVSALTNLAQGQAINLILSVDTYVLHVGTLTLYEYGGNFSSNDPVAAAIRAGAINVHDGHELPAKDLIALVNQLAISAGEAECVMYSRLRDYKICCDDDYARQKIETADGINLLTCTSELLKLAVEGRRITAAEAFQAHEKIVESGGFLKEVPIDYFRFLP